MELPILDRVAYIPVFRGERARFMRKEIDKPLAVLISPLTVRERRELAGQVSAMARQGGSGLALAQLNREIFLAHVHAVENLNVGGVAIANAKDLYDHPQMDNELVEEIQSAILRRGFLEDGDKKKFEPR